MRILIAIMAVLAAAGCKSGKVRTCDAGKEKVLVIFYDSAFSPDSLAERIEITISVMPPTAFIRRLFRSMFLSSA